MGLDVITSIWNGGFGMAADDGNLPAVIEQAAGCRETNLSGATNDHGFRHRWTPA